MIKAYNEIYKLILDELEKNYLKAYNKDFLKTMKRDSFKNALNKMVFLNKYDALSLMELLHPDRKSVV